MGRPSSFSYSLSWEKRPGEKKISTARRIEDEKNG